MTDQAKKKNPLFVVTNAGQDIEEVDSLWDYAMSKLGLKAYMAYFEEMIQYVLSEVDNYEALKFVNIWLEQIIDFLQSAIDKGEGLLKPFLGSFTSKA